MAALSYLQDIMPLRIFLPKLPKHFDLEIEAFASFVTRPFFSFHYRGKFQLLSTRTEYRAMYC